MFEVKDASRTLQFSGKLLAKSSSWRHGSYRWIEFELYKTDNGTYILARVGVSLVFHGAACPLVKRYGLIEGPSSTLEDDALPCDTCNPTFTVPVVFPEKYRYWAQVSEEAGPVLESLFKYDDGGARYLTKVAERLLDDASEVDVAISKIYRTEVIL